MRSLIVACLVTAGLWLVAPETADIHPAAASDHEGQTVRLHGVVVDVQAWDDGGRIRIAHEGHGIDARLDGPLPAPGAWITATGDVRRSQGDLLLYATAWQGADRDAPRVAWAWVAQQPDAWIDRDLHVTGTLVGDTLRDGTHRVQLGEGPRMEGPVVASGALAYDSRCACHVLHVRSLAPWTP